MAQQDLGYKRLFAHREMVSDLLTGFVREPWVAEVAVETLERVSGSYVSDDLREREDDIIWRVRWRGRWLYVYLLLEFQATVDRFMALRMLVYVGLLYQDLIREHQLTPGGRLPPVLPLVLYSGEDTWTAAREIGKLVETASGGLGEYRPLMPDAEIPDMESLQEARTMLAERVKDWTKQWREEGRQEGELAILRKQLEHKFGSLDAQTQRRIAAADSDQLLTWAERVLTAEKIEDMFS